MARDSLHARVLSSLGLIAARHKAGTHVLARSECHLSDRQLIEWRSETPDGAALRARRHESRPVVSGQTAQSFALHRNLVHAVPAADDGGVSAPARRAERVARQLVELLDAERQLAGGRA